MSSAHYQALLVVAFGGPEGPDDVIPFLENVLRGKNVPRERMLAVAAHYQRFGGVSPLNAQNRALIDALKQEFRDGGIKLPIFWGNRNWHPLLTDTLREMRDAGIGRALGLFTSAYSSYSSCRQYRENIAEAQAEAGPSAPQIDKLRAYFNHPGFIESTVERAAEALAEIPPGSRGATRLVFTAHSIPREMADGCRYEAQLQEASGLVADAMGIRHGRWSVVYQSRSGPPMQPWLEPDISDHLRRLRTEGVANVVVIPIGFLSDHMEVVYDLDIEARETAEDLGLKLVRAKTIGTHPRFVRMIRELVVERMTGAVDRPALGTMGASDDVCPADCCPSGRGR
jgi:ferrochelatase